MPQQLVLEPLGIITEPNKLGNVPAGSLAVMTDCVERSPGIIENLRAWQTRATISPLTGTTAMFLVVPPDSPRVLVIYNSATDWRYRWYDLSSGTALFSAAFLELNVNGLLWPQSVPTTTQPNFTYTVVGNQLFVNLYSTVIVWDTTNPQTSTEATPRLAGLQAPNIESAAPAGVGTAIPPKQWRAYTAILRRVYDRDRVALSPPAPAVYEENLSSADTKNTAITARLVSGLHKAGDIIEVYATPCKPNGQTGAFLGYRNGEEVGTEYRLVASHTITAAELTATLATILVVSPDSAQTEYLYTNQALQSAGAAAEPPPALKALLVHKGYVFGFAPTFPAQERFSPVGSWGIDASMSDAQAAAGFGQINLSGCTWSNGGTVVTVSPTSQLGRVFVGIGAYGTGLAGKVVSVGASTFTVDTPATAAGSSVSVSLFDDLEIAALGGSPDTVFASNWRLMVGGISTNDYVRFSALSLKLPPYTASNIFLAQPTDGVALISRMVDDARSPLLVRSTRGNNWVPQMTSYPSAATAIYPQYQPNAIVWSELNSPESWPVLNKDFFSRGSFCAAAQTRDAIVAFYTDSIWRISGTGGKAGEGYDWRYDPILTGVTIQGSQCIAAHQDKVYALTSEGLVVVEGASSVRFLTKGLVHDQLATPPWNDGAYSTSTAAFMLVDEENGEILFREPSAANGRMWIYNVARERLSQTISHVNPFHGGYSRYLRSPLVIGNDGGSWTIKAQTGSYGNFSLTYQPVYADNAFAQRLWQVLNVTAETAGATIQPTFNSTLGSSRTLDANGRAGFEVPRDTPAVGNTLQVKLDVTTTNRTKLTGFALDYRDYTDRRKNR